jgi:hypothetical protein
MRARRPIVNASDLLREDAMALTEKSFNQVKSILNRLDRSIDDLRARRGMTQNAGTPQNSGAAASAGAAPPGSQNQDRRAAPTTPGPSQTIGAPAPGAGTFGHTNGSGQGGQPRPGSQFGKATPILPKHG